MGTVLLQKSLPKMKYPLSMKILLINKSEKEREVKTNNFSVYLSTYPKSQSIMGNYIHIQLVTNNTWYIINGE